MKEKIAEGKKDSKHKHVTPLNLSVLSSQSQRKPAPLSACDCDVYTCNCDRSTDFPCVADNICAAENVDVCGIVWG